VSEDALPIGRRVRYLGCDLARTGQAGVVVGRYTSVRDGVVHEFRHVLFDGDTALRTGRPSAARAYRGLQTF